MSKVADWQKRWDDWKKTLAQPKNLGLRGTGVGESILKVKDAEMDFDKAKSSMKKITEACADLQHHLSELISLCKKTSDKHKIVFTTACQQLDAIREAAAARQRESTHEVDEIRKAVSDGCGESVKHLKGAKDMKEFGDVWHRFALEFERYGNGFPNLQAHIAKVKEKPAPTDGAKAEYIKIAEGCQKAAMVR